MFRFLKSEIIDKTNEGLSHFETDSFYCLHLVILFKIVKSGHIVYTKLKDKYSYCKRQDVYIKRMLHMKNWLLTLILALVLTILSACHPASDTTTEPPVPTPTPDGQPALPAASESVSPETTSSPEDEFLGIWLSDSKGPEGYLQFLEDGTYRMYYKTKLLTEGTYRATGSEATGLDMTGEYPAAFSIEGDTLTMKAAGSTETFTRSELNSAGN